jgi:transposase InsO family protein
VGTNKLPRSEVLRQPLEPSQFTSQAWLDALAAVDAKASMGRVGVCWDNAPAESWFGGFKNELVHPIGAFATRHEAQVVTRRSTCSLPTTGNEPIP